MKMSIITLNRPLQSLSVNGLGDQILQAIAEIFGPPRTKYYGFLEIFGPGRPNISEDQIFRQRSHANHNLLQ